MEALFTLPHTKNGPSLKPLPPIGFTWRSIFMKGRMKMRAAKFCERNVKVTEAGKAADILRRDYEDEVEVCVVDCFRRCLECRVKPFSRIQLTTVEAGDADSLVQKILQAIGK